MIERKNVVPEVEFVELETGARAEGGVAGKAARVVAGIMGKATKKCAPHPGPLPARPGRGEKSATSDSWCLGDIAFARSGDKGTTANIGVICRDSMDYADLEDWLTIERVMEFLAPIGIKNVERFLMPNLSGMNFLVHGILSRGLRSDVQGKALGQVILEMPIPGDRFGKDHHE